MLSIFGVTVVLYFIKILSGSKNYKLFTIFYCARARSDFTETREKHAVGVI